MRILTSSLVLLAACKKAPPEADEGFNDALVYAFATFDGDEADLAFALRELEAEIYTNMDVESKDDKDRALTPDRLTDSDLGEIEHPDRPPGDAVPVALGGLSAFPPSDHGRIQMLTDHTPVEPYSPEYYERTFLSGDDCWLDGSCDRMDTVNDLTKENFLMTVDYTFLKDFRWIDLNLPDPEGTESHGDGERLAIVARSWTTEEYAGRKDNAFISQSYTIEVWYPREGGGYISDDGSADSTGGGAVHMLSLWSETSFDGLTVTDEAVASTTRTGIDKNFKAQEAWIEEN
jgi:hypothetical protein